MSLHVSLISPERELFEGACESVSLPGSDAPFTVLQNHAAIISDLVMGVVSIQTAEKRMNYVIQGGFVEVSDNKVSALVESVTLPQEINLEEVKTELETLTKQVAVGSQAIDEKMSRSNYLRICLRVAEGLG